MLAVPAAVQAAPHGGGGGGCIVSAGVTITGTTVIGTAGDDSIDCRASRKGMTINGNGSDGLKGGDTIWGSNLADTILVQSAADPNCGTNSSAGVANVHGMGGNDQIRGGWCVTNAAGGEGADTLIAIAGCNYFSGDDDLPLKHPQPGADLIDLRQGQAVTWAVCGNNAYGGPGNDSIFASQTGPSGLQGDEGNDHLVGGLGNDGLVGGDGDDSLEGGPGNDNLEGDNGVDHLFGNEGDDFLTDSGPEGDFYDGGSNDTTPVTSTDPWGFTAAGDICLDNDGRGTSPAKSGPAPFGDGKTGATSATQDDSLSGCEIIFINPEAP
jgi:Ca2+-binding RTX toxin-like protein